MSKASVRSSRAPSAGDGSGGGIAIWIGVAAGLMVVAIMLAWWLGWLSFGTDPRVAEIQKMQEEAQRQFAANGGPSTVAEAMAAVTTMNTIRAQVEALPPHLREQVERRGTGMFQSAMRARIDSYYQAPAAQRQAILDRQIDQEEAMGKAMEAARSVAGAFGGGQAAGTSTSGSAASSQGGPPGSPRRGGNEDDRNRRIKSIIDRTTPEQRAQWVEYRRAMDERRAQRGLQPGGWGR